MRLKRRKKRSWAMQKRMQNICQWNVSMNSLLLNNFAKQKTLPANATVKVKGNGGKNEKLWPCWCIATIFQIWEICHQVTENHKVDNYLSYPLTSWFVIAVKIGLRHPDPVVETSSLSSVSPPDVWYRVSIPEEVTDRGCLSALQLEAITYAAQVCMVLGFFLFFF